MEFVILTKRDLKSYGDCLENKEEEALEKWNLERAGKGPFVLGVSGCIDTYAGHMELTLDLGNVVKYDYSYDPRGLGHSGAPDQNSVIINDVEAFDSHVIEQYIENYGHIGIALLNFYMDKKSIEERKPDYSGHGWIKVKRFKEEDYPSIEERYKALMEHHIEETNFLINKIMELTNQ